MHVIMAHNEAVLEIPLNLVSPKVHRAVSLKLSFDAVKMKPRDKTLL